MMLRDMQVFGGSRQLTPTELGRVFANMASDEQAEFWDGVAAGTQEWPDGKGYGHGEMQWCYLRDEMLKDDHAEGLAALQSISAWMLLHAWKTVDPW